MRRLQEVHRELFMARSTANRAGVCQKLRGNKSGLQIFKALCVIAEFASTLCNMR